MKSPHGFQTSFRREGAEDQRRSENWSKSMFQSVVISSDTDEEMERRQTSAAAASAFRVQTREESEPSDLTESDRARAMAAIFGEVSDTDDEDPHHRQGDVHQLQNRRRSPAVQLRRHGLRVTGAAQRR